MSTQNTLQHLICPGSDRNRKQERGIDNIIKINARSSQYRVMVEMKVSIDNEMHVSFHFRNVWKFEHSNRYRAHLTHNLCSMVGV